MPFRAWFCCSVFSPRKTKTPTSTRSTHPRSTQIATAETVGRWNPPDWAMAKKIATAAEPTHRHAPSRNRNACMKPSQVKKANQGLRTVSTAVNATRPMK